MVKFTTLAAGGVDYYQENKPASAKNGEIWLQINETAPDNPKDVTGTSEKWSTDLSSSSGRIERVDKMGDYIYAGKGQILYKLNSHDGSVVWSETIFDNDIRSLRADNGVVFCGDGYKGKTVAVDAVTGEIIWSHKLSDNSNLDNVVGDIEVYNGVVYTASTRRQSTIFAASRRDGSKIWQITPHISRTYALDTGDKKLFSGGRGDSNTDAKVAASDAKTGDLIWSHQHHTDQINDVEYANGIVYSNEITGVTVAANASDGSLIWKNSTNKGPAGDYPREIIYSRGLLHIAMRATATTIADASTGLRITLNPTENTTDGLAVENGVIYSGGKSEKLKAATLDGVNYEPVPDSYETKIYYNGKWLQSQNEGTTSKSGGSY